MKPVGNRFDDDPAKNDGLTPTSKIMPEFQDLSGTNPGQLDDDLKPGDAAKAITESLEPEEPTDVTNLFPHDGEGLKMRPGEISELAEEEDDDDDDLTPRKLAKFLKEAQEEEDDDDDY